MAFWSMAGAGCCFLARRLSFRGKKLQAVLPRLPEQGFFRRAENISGLGRWSRRARRPDRQTARSSELSGPFVWRK